MAGNKIHSTGGFWLILGALLLAASLRLLVWVAVAAAVHELGHLAAIRALGGRVDRFSLTGVGAVIRPRRERVFTYGEECVVALAGPAASLILAWVAAAWGRRFGGVDAYLLTGVSLALGVFNLLPAGPLDGGAGPPGSGNLAGGSKRGGRSVRLSDQRAGPGTGRPGNLGAGEERELYAAALRRLAAVPEGGGGLGGAGRRRVFGVESRENAGLDQMEQRLCQVKNFRRRKASRKWKFFSNRAPNFPMSQPLTSAHRMVPALTPSKCQSPKKAKDRITATLQLQQS